MELEATLLLDNVPLHTERTTLETPVSHEELLIPNDVAEHADEFKDGFSLLSEYSKSVKPGEYSHTPSYGPMQTMSAVLIGKPGLDGGVDARSIAYPALLKDAIVLPIDFLLGTEFEKLSDAMLVDFSRWINGRSISTSLLHHALFQRPSLAGQVKGAWLFTVALLKTVSIWLDAVKASTFIEYEDFCTQTYQYEFPGHLSEVTLPRLRAAVEDDGTTPRIIPKTLMLLALAELGEAVLENNRDRIPAACRVFRDSLKSVTVGTEPIIDIMALGHAKTPMISKHFAARLAVSAVEDITYGSRGEWREELMVAAEGVVEATQDGLRFTPKSFIDFAESFYVCRESPIFRCVFQRWFTAESLCGGQFRVEELAAREFRTHRPGPALSLYQGNLSQLLSQVALCAGLTLSRATRVMRHTLALSCEIAHMHSADQYGLHARGIVVRLALGMLVGKGRLGNVHDGVVTPYAFVLRRIAGHATETADADPLAARFLAMTAAVANALAHSCVLADRINARPVLAGRDFESVFEQFRCLDGGLYREYTTFIKTIPKDPVLACSQCSKLWEGVQESFPADCSDVKTTLPDVTADYYRHVISDLATAVKGNALAMMVISRGRTRSVKFDWKMCDFVPRLAPMKQ
ncbi:Mak10 subunit NatC N(alpha)-terminal acetyltransferase [Carpediemonas membranifera]|uniref:Mak10 subunit NatC N(Alpha)-terminal acetyltransferase n=1 Tax=Carpediemonas membranifera TaxID=201153 RepID=A0A8J6APQ2_9EUKA|nr:Mak10 subunit NatC N(alpha)-terminal acetyltransferase [Carpediemonas membranifera]|eukprot:KAG9390241.1 Mak10 subunit NatC N(alpha)-terminal acetyltransferase [Carpediemonas membranifera]